MRGNKMAKTFEELKAENAAAELTESQQQESIIPEAIDEHVEEEVNLEEADTESNDLGEGDKEEVLESWMQVESEESDGNFNNTDMAKLRRKLKGKVKERDEEIEMLRAENERLKKPQTQEDSKLPPRPTREQFDYDDDAYDAAVDEWQVKRFQAMQSDKQKESQADQQRQAQLDAIAKATDSHYERAQKLVDSGLVSAEAYTNADTAVRTAFEHVFPNQGDSIADAVISQLNSLGEGSEKVMFHLGRNPTALGELKSRLTNDPTGMQAMAYLGTLHAKATQSPTKKVSQAPKPATQLKGEENTSSASKPMLRKYQAAHKSGNAQEAFSIKREARQKGIDTSSW